MPTTTEVKGALKNMSKEDVIKYTVMFMLLLAGMYFVYQGQVFLITRKNNPDKTPAKMTAAGILCFIVAGIDFTVLGYMIYLTVNKLKGKTK